MVVERSFQLLDYVIITVSILQQCDRNSTGTLGGTNRVANLPFNEYLICIPRQLFIFAAISFAMIWGGGI